MDSQTKVYDLIEANLPIHEILATLSKEQLVNLFDWSRSKLLRTDPKPFESIFTDDFEEVKPPEFCFTAIDGESIYSNHPVVEYILKVISPIQKSKQCSKQALIKKIEETIQVFLVLKECSLFDFAHDVDNLTHFEEHLRTLALQIFQKVLETKEANDARREERTEKRKELYNLRRRVKRAEQNLVWVTENVNRLYCPEHNLVWATKNVNRLREEQHNSEEYLLSLVD
jgi:hypothetical protein